MTCALATSSTTTGATATPTPYLKSHHHNLPLLFTANHYSISATITTGQRHPLGSIFGDLLVPPANANGRHPTEPPHPVRVDLAPTSDTHTTSTCSTIQPSTTPWKARLQKQSPARNSDAALH